MGRLVGYGVSQVPTNGMLGGMAYQDPINVTVNNISVGGGTLTGTASQPLQVTGGAYVSGSVGIGTNNPATKLEVNGTIRMSAVPGTNTNAALPVLFQTSAGNIDGGSSLTFNPGGDALSVNGNSITASQFSGAGSLSVFTCANGAGQYDFRAASDSLRFIAVSSEAGRFDNSGSFLIGFSTSTGTASQRLQVTGGAYVSGSVGIGTTNPQARLSIGSVSGFQDTITTVATTAATTIDSFATASFRSARAQVQITQSTNYQTSDVLIIHNGTTASIVEYGSIATNDYLGTFSVSVSGSNCLLQINMSSATSATVKVLSQRITV
jgi:hypothetical protein